MPYVFDLDPPGLSDLAASEIDHLSLESQIELLETAFGLDADAIRWTNITFGKADSDAPVLSDCDPASGAENVPIATTIGLSITDPTGGYGLNELSVIFEINGDVAWSGDMEQPGFTVTKTAIVDGFRWVIQPDVLLPEFAWTSVHVYATDLSPTPNVLNTTYQFKTVQYYTDILKNVQILSRNLLCINLNNFVVSSGLLNSIDSYLLENITESKQQSILGIVNQEDRLVDKIYVLVDNLNYNDSFLFTIKDGKLASSTGIYYHSDSVSFVTHKTKIDFVFSRLSSSYNLKQQGASVKALTEAIFISDDRIGGDY